MASNLVMLSLKQTQRLKRGCATSILKKELESLSQKTKNISKEEVTVLCTLTSKRIRIQLQLKLEARSK